MELEPTLVIKPTTVGSTVSQDNFGSASFAPDITDIPSQLPAVSRPQVTVELPYHAISICVIIMSIGAVVGLHDFLYLSFLHPDAANTVIPLILVPVLNYGLNRYSAYLASQKDKSNYTNFDFEKVRHVQPNPPADSADSKGGSR